MKYTHAFYFLLRFRDLLCKASKFVTFDNARYMSNGVRQEFVDKIHNQKYEMIIRPI